MCSITSYIASTENFSIIRRFLLGLDIENSSPNQVFVLHAQGVFSGRKPLLAALGEVEERNHAGIIALLCIAIGQRAGLLGLDFGFIA